MEVRPRKGGEMKPTRNHNDERGGVRICAGGRLHDTATIPLLREAIESWRARRVRGMDRWELWREPDQGWGPLVRFDVSAGQAPPHWRPDWPIVGLVRWFRNGMPFGTVLDGYPMPVCTFCKGEPVIDASEWLDGERKPPLPCPRCGKVAT